MSYQRLQSAVLNVLASKSGAAMAEYGLLVALIAVAAIAGTSYLGGTISNKFYAIAYAL